MEHADRPAPAPTSAYPRPDFPRQEQEHPGWTGPMDPPPDQASYLTAEIVNATGGTPLP